MTKNVTIAVDAQLLAKARKRLQATGKSLNQFLREQLQRAAGDDDAEAWIKEFKRLSGKGNSHGWKFNRDEIHER